MQYKKPDWIRDSPNTYSHHFAHPEISVEDHRRSQRLQLADQLLQKHRIYLDTKFWILLRDANLGRRDSTEDTELLAALRDLRKGGKAICPLSYSMIHELWLQNDLESRRATASIMDELSGAVCLQAPHFLFDIELRYLMYSAAFPKLNQSSPKHLVWTKAAYYVGEPILSCEALEDDVVQAIQKSIDDSMFDTTLSDLVEALKDKPTPSSADINDLATDLTKGKKENPESSFDELYRQEISGGLEGHAEVCADIMESLCRATGFTGSIGESERKTAAIMLRGLVQAGVKAKKIGIELPQLHINACLHAALRWDNQRNYKRGDCEDFRHAGSALPYCSHFLTEKSLKHLLCNKPLKLDAQYEVQVFDDSRSALTALSALF